MGNLVAVPTWSAECSLSKASKVRTGDLGCRHALGEGGGTGLSASGKGGRPYVTAERAAPPCILHAHTCTPCPSSPPCILLAHTCTPCPPVTTLHPAAHMHALPPRHHPASCTTHMYALPPVTTLHPACTHARPAPLSLPCILHAHACTPSPPVTAHMLEPCNLHHSAWAPPTP